MKEGLICDITFFYRRISHLFVVILIVFAVHLALDSITLIPFSNEI